MKHRPVQFDVRRRGAVLFMVLMAMTLLVGVLFFALNAGTQVNRRLEMQNAADATAIGGAGWVAKSMNVVSMNNAAMARMIAMAAVFDSMPLAAEMTIAEQTGNEELSDALKKYSSVGNRFTIYERDNFFRLGLAELYKQLDNKNEETDLAIVEAIDEQFNHKDELTLEDGAYDVGQATQWKYQGIVDYYVDNDGPGFSKTGMWERRNVSGQHSPCTYISNDMNATATWTRKIPRSEQYLIILDYRKVGKPSYIRLTVKAGDNFDVKIIDLSNYTYRDIVKMHIKAGTVVTVTMELIYDNKMQKDDDANMIADAVVFRTRDTKERIGYFWRAALAMDKFSQSTLNNLVKHSQENAKYGGDENNAAAAFTVPIKPFIPCERKDFGSFESVLVDHVEHDTNNAYVVKSDLVDHIYQSDDKAMATRVKKKTDGSHVRIKGWGSFPDYVAGGAIPDFEYPHRLGPFASLYRWRFPWDSWQVTFQDRYGYTAFGPYEHTLRRVLDGFGQAGWYWDDGISETSRFSYHLRAVTKAKLAMMFKHVRQPRAGEVPIVPVQYSDRWITDYEKALEFVGKEKTEQAQAKAEHEQAVKDAEDAGTDPPAEPSYISKVMTTRYYRVHVKSTVPFEIPDTSTPNPDWMNPSAWQDGEPTLIFVPRRWFSWQLNGKGPYDDAEKFHLQRWIYDRTGWRPISGASDGRGVDPASWRDGEWYKLGNYVWARRYKRMINWDRELKLPIRIKDPRKKPPYSENDYVKYPIYYFEIRVFGGIEIRNEVYVSDLLQGATLDDLPAPILLNTDDYDYHEDHDEDIRRKAFTYLGVAGRGGKAKIWPKQFTLGNPSGMITGVSQAIVFNNSSWDLWTQDWQVKLVPVTKWENWQEKMADDLEDVDDMSGSNPDDVKKMIEYLRVLDPKLMNSFLSH